MIWDYPGQESQLEEYFEGTDCCFLVFDIFDRESFDNLNQFKEQFFELGGIDPDMFPLVLLGNKSDLETAENPRKVTVDEISHWCEVNGHINYFEVSALTGQNIEQAFLANIKEAVN